jgi:hypothetical protein
MDTRHMEGRLLRILLIGDAPSKYNLDPIVPFVGARCFPRLNAWIKKMSCSPDSVIINQCDFTFVQLLSFVNYWNLPVVALGNKASKALRDIPHFKLPHPSGLNRQINDKNYINYQLLACKRYILNEKTLARARSLDASLPKA